MSYNKNEQVINGILYKHMYYLSSFICHNKTKLGYILYLAFLDAYHLGHPFPHSLTHQRMLPSGYHVLAPKVSYASKGLSDLFLTDGMILIFKWRHGKRPINCHLYVYGWVYCRPGGHLGLPAQDTAAHAPPISGDAKIFKKIGYPKYFQMLFICMYLLSENIFVNLKKMF